MTDSRAPGKQSSVATSSGVGSSASSPTNSAIQVEPTWATSGAVPAAIAEVNLSWALSQGTGVTSTVASGFCSWKPLSSSGSFSPSAPIAQTVSEPVAAPSAIGSAGAALSPPEVSSGRPQAASRPSAAAAPSPVTARREGRAMWDMVTPSSVQR